MNNSNSPVHKPKMQLSQKVCSIPEALSVYINNVVYEMKRRGEELCVLSLGEAFFDIPMFSFDDIDFKKGYHYSESRGLYELRHILSKYYNNRYNASIDPDSDLIISAGSKPLIYMAFQAVLNAGDEVLIHEPAWLSYPEEIKLAEGVPVFIPFDCGVDSIEKYITNKTKMIVICNPNNPAGKVYSRNELEFLYKLCRPRGIYILVDEAYSDFLDNDLFCSMTSIVPDKDGIIVVNSLSKNMGISGWRIGYAISSDDVIYNMLKLNQHLITCPSTLLLLYISKHFDEMLDITLPQAQEVVRKRETINQYCKSIGLIPLDGTSTFYLFINIADYKYSSLDLALYLLTKYHISVVPGLAYGNSTERFIRISVGTENIDDIKRSLDLIKQIIMNDEIDKNYINDTLTELKMNHFSSDCQHMDGN
ncbi:MAG: pyridoxal phosphate-dependent aminotransferase [Clostridiales bacterium]|nr:pyridoxal phosphate-dependent aminotransferase [Clostridiales bacterium]